MSSDPRDLGFVAPAKIGEDAEPADIFSQLLRGEVDDPEAVEPSDAELATLEEEFVVVRKLRAKKAWLKEKLSAVQEQLTAQEQRMLNAMDREGTSQFRGVTGDACHIAMEYTTTIEDEVAFLKWVKEHAEELFSVNAQTRTSFVRREYRDKGVAIDDPRFPSGLKVGERRSLRVRAARAAEVET
jgi:hypothetical protein